MDVQEQTCALCSDDDQTHQLVMRLWVFFSLSGRSEAELLCSTSSVTHCVQGFICAIHSEPQRPKRRFQPSHTPPGTQQGRSSAAAGCGSRVRRHMAPKIKKKKKKPVRPDQSPGEQTEGTFSFHSLFSLSL